VPAAYIDTKREAEERIERMIKGKTNYRGVYLRPSEWIVKFAPARGAQKRFGTEKGRIDGWMMTVLSGLVYHPHLRPYTAAVAAFLDLSSTVQSKLPQGVPTPSELLHVLSEKLVGVGKPSALDSVARALSLPPIHVDQVAEAVCVAVDKSRTDVRGVYGVREMRDLITT
jgi:hypothetical protein